jgi:hypothetical protein
MKRPCPSGIMNVVSEVANDLFENVGLAMISKYVH